MNLLMVMHPMYHLQAFTFPNSVQLQLKHQDISQFLSPFWVIPKKLRRVFKSQELAFCHNLPLKLFQYLPNFAIYMTPLTFEK